MTFDPKSLPTQATLTNRLPYVHMISMCCIARGRYEFLKIFKLRPCIWPLWPQMTMDKKWSNNFCRGSQALSYAHVTWSCYVICRRSSDLSENNLFDPCDLGCPLTWSRVIWHMRAGSFIIVTKFHWNRSKQLEDTFGYMVDRRRRN